MIWFIKSSVEDLATFPTRDPGTDRALEELLDTAMQLMGWLMDILDELGKLNKKAVVILDCIMAAIIIGLNTSHGRPPTYWEILDGLKCLEGLLPPWLRLFLIPPGLRYELEKKPELLKGMMYILGLQNLADAMPEGSLERIEVEAAIEVLKEHLRNEGISV